VRGVSRADYGRFKAAWQAGNMGRGLECDPGIATIDREMHRDRVDLGGRQRTFPADIGTLPEGVFVALPAETVPVLLWGGSLWAWAPTGYGSPRERPSGMVVTVLTPRSTVGAIAAGYVPQVHESLGRGVSENPG
jgi:hypothetical protein